MTTRFNLDVLSENYWLIKVDPDQISSILHPIMNNLLATEKQTFYNLTFTNEEISLIINEKFKDQYKSVNSKCGPYIGVAVITSDPGIDEAGVLANVIGIFAKYHIAIICCSTYMQNYIFFSATQNDQFIKLIANEEDYRINN